MARSDLGQDHNHCTARDEFTPDVRILCQYACITPAEQQLWNTIESSTAPSVNPE